VAPRKGSGRFSLKQLLSFVLKKTNIIKVDQVELNTSNQPGARLLYHGEGTHESGKIYPGYLYNLSGSDKWVRYDSDYSQAIQAANDGDPARNSLLALSLSTDVDAQGYNSFGAGRVHDPKKDGMLLRGMAKVITWGNATVGPHVGSSVYAYGGMISYHKPDDADLRSPFSKELVRPVGTVMEIIESDAGGFGLFREVLLDFNTIRPTSTAPLNNSLSWRSLDNPSNSSVTLADHEIKQKILYATPAAAVNWTTPTATDMIQEFGLIDDGADCFDFWIINLATVDGRDITLVAGTGVTLFGSPVVKARDTADNANSPGSAHFTVMKTSSTACTIVRLS